jgi:hypothetical protein
VGILLLNIARLWTNVRIIANYEEVLEALGVFFRFSGGFLLESPQNDFLKFHQIKPYQA